MVNVAKAVSETWKNLDPSERRVWEEKARLDKERYEREKLSYKGPWKVKAPPRKSWSKDPSAPKKPMSAYLSFSNSKRIMVKQMYPNASNAQVSKILSVMWRDAPASVKQGFIDQEAQLREEYKTEVAAWRSRKTDERDEDDPTKLEESHEGAGDFSNVVSHPLAATATSTRKDDSSLDDPFSQMINAASSVADENDTSFTMDDDDDDFEGLVSMSLSSTVAPRRKGQSLAMSGVSSMDLGSSIATEEKFLDDGLSDDEDIMLMIGQQDDEQDDLNEDLFQP